MNKITQDMQYRQSLLKYADRYGVTKAAIEYKTNRQYVYRWQKRYDGTWESLKDKSHRPHHHPNEHTPEELKLIADMRRRNPEAGIGCVLGKAVATRLYQINYGAVQSA